MSVLKENKSGEISEFYDDDTGVIAEDGGSDVDFHHPGAKIEFIVGDLVNFMKITTPRGKVIVRDIKKKNV